jgi:tRNA U34 5-carboxymethylaminomethyl modifying GTPase MnmE/TrmE
MADERYVNQDQHRGDLAGLRGELKEEIAGLRQDVAVIAKTVEIGFAEQRQEMTLLHQEMRDMRQELRQEMRDMRQELRQEIRELRATTQRQLWVLIAVVVVTMVGGMIKIVFFA